ncbi:MAG: hypothetical protein JWP87_5787 [Labilithrix sp.]|nr:hypothetical protein [Labilithrix sp.]
MSRTLNDDFDADDLPGGPLDLEKGSAQVGTGVASSYGGDGIDFDDELYGDDAGPGAALELDLPHAPARPQVPDLALDKAPAPAAPAPGSSGSLPAARSGAHPAAPPPSVPRSPASDGHHGFAPPPSSSNAGMPPVSSSGRLPAAHGGSPGSDPHMAASHANEPPPPPAKPSAAAVIAKYPAPPTGIKHAPMYAVRVVMRQLELRSELESLRRRRSPDVPLYEAALRAYDAKTFRLGMAINCAAFAVATFIFFLPVIIRFVRD